MLKSLAAVASIAVLFPLALTAPAHADTENCVSRKEFRAVDKGWRISRVEAKFDVVGKQTYFYSGTAYSNAGQGREYRGCPEYSYVALDFERKDGDSPWRVTGKYAYWG